MENKLEKNPKKFLEVGFSEEFAQAIAMGLFSKKEICANYGVSKEEYMMLADNEYFRSQVAEYRRQLTAKGFTRQMKADAAVDSLIPFMYGFIKDEEIAGAARVGMMRELRALSSVQATETVAPGKAIVNIILSNDEPYREKVHDVTPAKGPKVVLSE
jgi:hypothetical protein